MLALRIAGTDANFYTLLSLIVLLGLAVKIAVPLVSLSLRAHGDDETIPSAATRVARRRFRVALGSGLPFLLGTGLLLVVGGAGSVGREAIGASVVGGTIGVIVLGSLFVPVLYAVAQWLVDLLTRDRVQPLDEIWLGSKSQRGPLHGVVGALFDIPVAVIRFTRRLVGLQRRRVYTVTGSIIPEKLGTTLPHEHVLVFPDRVMSENGTDYDPEDAFKRVGDYLSRLRPKGVRSLIECTTAHRGRDPKLLKRLSESLGLQIVTNTGYYGGRARKYLPGKAFQETADELAKRWLTEFRKGIDNTGIRPGFIKIGVGEAPISATDQTLVRAAARTHLESGLTIASHTPSGQAAMEQLELLESEGVDPSAWIWIHAQEEKDRQLLIQAAGRGAWVELDDIGAGNILGHVELIEMMKRHDLLDRVLISHNRHGYQVGQPRGGKIRTYDDIFMLLLPALFRGGFKLEQIEQLTVINPMHAFSVYVRRSKPSGRETAPTP